jgi:hypothetical protein
LNDKEIEIKDSYNFYKIKGEITTAIELNDFIIKHESNEHQIYLEIQDKFCFIQHREILPLTDLKLKKNNMIKFFIFI